MEEYSTEIREVSNKIDANLSVLMGMDEDGLKRKLGEFQQGIRMNYYPTCSRPDLVLGISPHSDSSLFTLLLQDNEISGLQIKHKEVWIDAKPIPNSLVLNIGDAIEVSYNVFMSQRFHQWSNFVISQVMDTKSVSCLVLIRF